IIDPSCSLIFEAEETEFDIMRRRPRRATERLFSHGTVGLAVLQGLSVLAVCLAIAFLARPTHGPDAAPALSFPAFVVSFLMIILVNRSWPGSLASMLRVPNTAMWWVMAGTASFLAAILTMPTLRRLFSFSPLHADDLLISIVAGLSCL